MWGYYSSKSVLKTVNNPFSIFCTVLFVRTANIWARKFNFVSQSNSVITNTMILPLFVISVICYNRVKAFPKIQRFLIRYWQQKAHLLIAQSYSTSRVGTPISSKAQSSKLNCCNPDCTCMVLRDIVGYHIVGFIDSGKLNLL